MADSQEVSDESLGDSLLAVFGLSEHPDDAAAAAASDTTAASAADPLHLAWEPEPPPTQPDGTFLQQPQPEPQPQPHDSGHGLGGSGSFFAWSPPDASAAAPIPARVGTRSSSTPRLSSSSSGSNSASGSGRPHRTTKRESIKFHPYDPLKDSPASSSSSSPSPSPSASSSSSFSSSAALLSSPSTSAATASSRTHESILDSWQTSRARYKCRRCGMPKRGHECPGALPSDDSDGNAAHSSPPFSSPASDSHLSPGSFSLASANKTPYQSMSAPAALSAPQSASSSVHTSPQLRALVGSSSSSPSSSSSSSSGTGSANPSSKAGNAGSPPRSSSGGGGSGGSDSGVSSTRGSITPSEICAYVATISRLETQLDWARREIFYLRQELSSTKALLHQQQQHHQHHHQQHHQHHQHQPSHPVPIAPPHLQFSQPPPALPPYRPIHGPSGAHQQQQQQQQRHLQQQAPPQQQPTPVYAPVPHVLAAGRGQGQPPQQLPHGGAHAHALPQALQYQAVGPASGYQQQQPYLMLPAGSSIRAWPMAAFDFQDTRHHLTS